MALPLDAEAELPLEESHQRYVAVQAWVASVMRLDRKYDGLLIPLILAWEDARYEVFKDIEKTARDIVRKRHEERGGC